MNTSIFVAQDKIDAALAEQQVCDKINTFLCSNIDVEKYMGLERFDYVRRANKLEELIVEQMMLDQDKLNGKVVQLITPHQVYGAKGTIIFTHEQDGRTRYEAGIEMWVVFDQEGRIHSGTGKPSACLVPLSNLEFIKNE